MDRRKFLKTGAVGAMMMAASPLGAKMPGASMADATENGKTLKVKFLGTGAAGGLKHGGRRHSSILVDDSFIIDFTDDCIDMLPENIRPDTIFYTHSHSDHFQPSAALAIGVKTVYLNHTWYDVAVKAFRDAAVNTGAKIPKVIPTYFGVPVQMGSIKVTPLIANHPTENFMEESQIYLLEKDDVRLLYATDTSGIPGRSARVAGIDAHQKGVGISALIMEATMADPDDFRLYCHSSTHTVENTVNVLLKTERLHMAPDEKVWITHIAASLHPADINASLPEHIRAAEDGLEVIFKRPRVK